MKETIKAFLLGGSLFGIMMGIPLVITGDLTMVIIAMLFFGVTFGFFLSIFVFFQTKGFKRLKHEIVGNSNVIFDGGANHFMGTESVGGWLCLTDKELIFKSHNFNIQRHTSVIDVNQITEVRTSLTFGLVPNGLKIITTNSEERFVVFNRKIWIQKINETIASNVQRV